MLQLINNLSPDDTVIALITGGGSALLAAPLPPMTLADEIELNEQLLSSGLAIGAMNTIRRHVSVIALITGGGSALLAAPLPPMTLADEIELNEQLLSSGLAIGAMNTIRRHVSVIALITGGGSALLAAPLPPMTLADEIELNEQLLSSGLAIGAMNTIRRHVSAIKGGRLGAASLPAKLVTFLVSDVPGDDPAEVASGPTYSGHTTPDDALDIIRTHGLQLPANVIKALHSDAAAGVNFRSETHILASAGKSLAAVEQHIRALGFDVINLGDAVEGEARAVARAHAQFALEQRARGWRGLIISGGETTVTIRGSGRGGRNTEYLLALAIELAGVEGVHCFAADTDGVDATEYLFDNNAFSAFTSIDQLFTLGPSGTNVNDLRLILLG